MQTRSFASLLIVITIGALLLAPAQATGAPQAASPLAHVVVIGASVSAGYGIGRSPLMGAVTLADIVQSSITLPHDAPRNLASPLVFLSWPAYMTSTASALTKDPPSALIAVDYLFWSVHGTMTDADRMKQLDSALAGLEALSCPILVGDLPDVTNATIGPAPMITPNMMPSAAVRDSANLRIRNWSNQHANVTLVPLAELMKKVIEGSELQIRDNSWKGKELSRLLQDDHLHATAEGLVAIWISAADSWLRNDSKLSASALELRAQPLIDAANLKMNK